MVGSLPLWPIYGFYFFLIVKIIFWAVLWLEIDIMARFIVGKLPLWPIYGW